VLNFSLDQWLEGEERREATVESGSLCRIVFKKTVNESSPVRVEVMRDTQKRG
jgi:hypothetical protein